MIPTLSRIYRSLSASLKRYLFFALVLAILAALLEVATVSLIPSLLSFVLISPSVPSVNQYTAAVEIFIISNSLGSPKYLAVFFFSILIVFSSFVRLFSFRVNYRFGAMVAHYFSCFYLSCFLRQPYEAFLASSASRVISLATTYSTYLSTAISMSMQIITAFLISSFLLVALVFLNPIYNTSFFAALVLLFLLSLLFTRGGIRRAGVLMSSSSIASHACVEDSFSLFSDITLSSSQSFYLTRFSEASRSLRMAESSNQFLAGAPRFIVEAFAIVAILFLSLISTSSGSQYVTLSFLTGTLYGLLRLLPSLQQVFGGFSGLKGLLPSLQFFVNEAFDSSALLDPERNSSFLFVSPDTINLVELSSVSYSYPFSSSKVLKDINLVIPYGSRVALVGSSGCGKTTISLLISTLLSPSSGSIRIGIHEASEVSCFDNWRSLVSFLPQEVSISPGTIASNIALGVNDTLIDYDLVSECLHLSSLSGFVDMLDDGIFTMIGESGVNLSVGQKQRLGLARALYRQPMLLILDEPSSSLDPLTESECINSIVSLPADRTVLMVAHRLNTLSQFDLVYWIHDGVVKLAGPPSLVLPYYIGSFDVPAL